MLERVVLVAILFAAGYGLYRMLRYFQLRQATEAAAQDDTSENAAASILQDIKRGVPAIVYFTTPGCIACKTAQRPAFDRLREMLEGDLQIIEINAADQPDAAQRWGVMSAPTTFVLDAELQAQYVNNGVAPAPLLWQQLATLYDFDVRSQVA